MPFQARIGFMTENGLQEFREKSLPRLPGCKPVEESAQAESSAQPAESEEGEGAFNDWLPLSISSPTAARDLCHQLMAFLNHAKQSAVRLEWVGSDGSTQFAQISGQLTRDLEIAAMRLSASVKAHNDAEKAAAKAAGGGAA
jgi:hypothetical protein